MDIIYLKDLRIDTVIGIYEWERRIKQTLTFDIEMAADAGKAAQSDSIDDTVSYEAVANRVTGYVGASEFELLETLAEKVAGILLDEFNVRWVPVAAQQARRGARRTRRGHRHRAGQQGLRWRMFLSAPAATGSGKNMPGPVSGRSGRSFVMCASQPFTVTGL